MFEKSNITLILTCLLAILFPLGINAQNDPTMGAADNSGPLTVHQIIVGVILIITGLFFCFYGRKYFRPTLFLIGFYVGTIIAWVALSNGEPRDGFAGAASPTIILVVSLAIGFIVGLVFVCCSTIAIWLMGALGGYALALFILAWGSGGVIHSELGRIIFIVVLTFVGLLLTCCFKDILIILSTAFVGAYAIILGIDMFVRTGFAQSVRAFLVNRDINYETNTKVYLMLGGMIVLFILGSLYQYRYHRGHSFGDTSVQPESGKKRFNLPWKRV